MGNLPLRNSSCEDEILSENLFIILLKLYPSIGGKGDKTSDRGGNKTSSKKFKTCDMWHDVTIKKYAHSANYGISVGGGEEV